MTINIDCVIIQENEIIFWRMIAIGSVQEQSCAIFICSKGGVFGVTGLFGRREILTSVDKITKANVVEVLNNALAVHNENALQIDYLYQYMKGNQPILHRKKKVRPEICNKIVENHASEIALFTSGYFLGEPVTYIRRGERESASGDISRLNDYMFFEDKASHDKDMATWMAIGGVGYRMILPDKDAGGTPDESPFELDTPDPRDTFVVYHSGFGHKRMMGVRQIYRKNTELAGEAKLDYLCCGYTATHYFEVENGVLKKWKPHSLGDIPIFEYRLNMTRTGAFEPAVPLLDTLNNIVSNRMDGIEQFVQSFLKFINCEIDKDSIAEFREKGAIVIKSLNGMPGDVQLVSQELNQSQVQTLVDYIYDQILIICGMPTSTKGGASTSDTGAAVFLRDGWSQCEARAKDTELLFKKSEKEFLRLALKIIRDTQDFPLSLAEVECKFTRRQHDALLTKTQSLNQMLEAGLDPTVAIAACGLFNDPEDVALQSRPYLEKWKQTEKVDTGDKPVEIPGENRGKQTQTAKESGI